MTDSKTGAGNIKEEPGIFYSARRKRSANTHTPTHTYTHTAIRVYQKDTEANKNNCQWPKLEQ